ncbi:MAG: tRNA 4-thiouridine(8) synthase ThiI [Defluviitaleaceae bacterium]|nr:tRNA 4-thiouridine(8) synthase ThiI [Defluviitaleaceae bacterium]
MFNQEILLIKYGEIALRGGNRRIYENMLLTAIRKNISSVEQGAFVAYKEQGRFVVRANDPAAPLSHLIPHITCIFGITGVCRGIRLETRDMEGIKAATLEYMKQNHSPAETFRITTKRADKNFPGRSDEISYEIGNHLFENIEGLKVNLSNPDFNLVIEIRNNIYIYSQNTEVIGLGGLPPGSAGKGVLLLSGGIDSPVAGFLAAKRGIDLTAIYYHSPPYTSGRAKEKVLDLARRIAHYSGKIKLIVVNFTDIQLHLSDHTPPEKITILLKRSMLKMADMTAQNEKALVLVTGDAVGQVASQTLHSLNAMTGATTLQILRPLACYDKQEIISLARKIETYPISIRPFDDCCTLFLPKHPETKPKLSIIQSIENAVPNLEEMMQKALDEAEIYRF